MDAAGENVSAAAAHAEGVGLDIRYMAGEVAALDIGTFDLVTCVEVIEHVADKPAFLRDVAASLEARFGVGHATLQVESGENPCGGCC